MPLFSPNVRFGFGLGRFGGEKGSRNGKPGNLFSLMGEGVPDCELRGEEDTVLVGDCRDVRRR